MDVAFVTPTSWVHKSSHCNHPCILKNVVSISEEEEEGDMEISENKFFLFWTAISYIFLKLGFNTMDKTELSNSVPPLVTFLFKHSLAIFTCYSSVHAFFPSLMKKSVSSYLLFFTTGILPLMYLTGGSWAHCYFPIYTVASMYNLFLIRSDIVDFIFDCKYKWRLVVLALYIVYSTAFAIFDSALGWNNSKSLAHTLKIFSRHLNFPTFLFMVTRAGEYLTSTDPVHDQNFTISDDSDNRNYKIKKSIEFAGGLLGTVLFQNFFRLNSFKEVVVFLYLAVAWLANITLLTPSHDLGIFNFLLANAIVGCSVSEFGLRGNTWIAYAASVFLYCLRLKIQSLSIVNRGSGNGKVILW